MLVEFSVFVAMVVPVVFRVKDRERRTHLENPSPGDAFQRGQIGFETQTGGKEYVSSFRALQIGGCGFEMMGIGVRSDQIDDFDSFSADFSREIAEQRMQRRHFQFGGVQPRSAKEKKCKPSPHGAKSPKLAFIASHLQLVWVAGCTRYPCELLSLP